MGAEWYLTLESHILRSNEYFSAALRLLFKPTFKFYCLLNFIFCLNKNGGGLGMGYAIYIISCNRCTKRASAIVVALSHTPHWLCTAGHGC